MTRLKFAKLAGACWLMLATSAACTVGGSNAPHEGDVNCSSVLAELEAEREAIQRCDSNEDCGASEGAGTCGCTRALPIRIDADPRRYRGLIARANACDFPSGSTCDCPNADGFRCLEGICAWNFTK